MVYEVIINRVCPCSCGYEGDLVINFDGIELKVCYQAPAEFIHNHVIEKSEYIKHSENDYEIIGNLQRIPLDLWLVYGNGELTPNNNKLYPRDQKVCGGRIQGEVLGIHSEDRYRVDCGIIIDVENEKRIDNIIQVGDFVEVNGTYRVYFPGTSFNYEN